MKLKKQVLKIHYKKLGEPIEPIIEKLTKIIESTKKLRELLKTRNSKSETPQLVVEITRKEIFSQPTIQKNQNDSHAGVIYHPSQEQTLTTMETASKFNKIQERPNGDIFCHSIPLENLGGWKLQNDEDENDMSTDNQEVFIDTSENSKKIPFI